MDKAMSAAEDHAFMMYEHGMSKTKWKIFVRAIELFAERGVEAVSMRALAKEVGVGVGSIYHCFSSKEQLLLEIYEFYEQISLKIGESEETVLRYAEEMRIEELYTRFAIFYPPQYERIMGKIAKIALARMYHDERANQLIKTTVDEQIERKFRPVMVRLMEQGRIRELDIDAFCCIVKSMCYYSSQVMCTRDEISHGQWENMLQMLFALSGRESAENGK